MRSKKKQKAILKRAYTNLGHLRAEDDDSLGLYYVSSGGFLDRALDRTDPAIFFRGPKGIGKSAVLKMVELYHHADINRVVRINPDDLAFTALANISTQTPLVREAEKNQWLFKSLWNYVLAMRLLKSEYPARATILDKVLACFRSEQQNQARHLLSLSFTDAGQVEPSLTSTMIRLVNEIEIAIETSGVRGSALVKLDPSHSEVSHQLVVLNLVDQVARALPTLLHKEYFVLIDDLDLHWHNEPVQNALIAALFTSMAKLRAAKNIKFVVAIRSDIYRYLPIEDKDKSRDWICDIFWDRNALQALIEKRMLKLHNIGPRDLWGTMFPQGAFDLMIQHSLMRPRELIRQTELAFEFAFRAGHAEVQPEDLHQAFSRNAREKIEELEQEYGHTLPGIADVLLRFSGWDREFPLSRLQELSTDLTLEVICPGDKPPRYSWAGQYDGKPLELAKQLVAVGFLQVKVSQNAPPEDEIDPALIDKIAQPWFAIRPIYRPCLALREP